MGVSAVKGHCSLCSCVTGPDGVRALSWGRQHTFPLPWVLLLASARAESGPDCRSHPRDWVPPSSWSNASFCPKLHPIHCSVYDSSGTITINGTYFIFPDGAPSDTHWASTDLLRWRLRNQGWFDGLTESQSRPAASTHIGWITGTGKPRLNGGASTHNPRLYPMRAMSIPGGEVLGTLDHRARVTTPPEFMVQAHQEGLAPVPQHGWMSAAHMTPTRGIWRWTSSSDCVLRPSQSWCRSGCQGHTSVTARRWRSVRKLKCH